MSVGQKWPSEIFVEIDPETGAEVTRLTGIRSNHNHLYFTNNSYFDHNSKIVICGDRDGSENFYSVDLKTGEITQLSDLPRLPYGKSYRLYEGIVDPVRNFCYFFADTVLYRLDLMSYELKELYCLPEGYAHHVVSCAYDSDYVYTSIYEKPKLQGAKPGQYSGLTETWNAHTLSQILQIKNDGSAVKVIWEEHNFIAHVNANPHNDMQLTFCHEGSWNIVDHRIWGLDVKTGKVWKIHEIPAGDNQGHEYWYQDSLHIGYHGHKANGDRYMGRVTWDNTSNIETAFPYNTGHIYSINEQLIVGDGGAEGRYIRVWPWNGEVYEEGRALCLHDSTFKMQASHVHPRFSPDGKYVLYTSDRTGYNQVYLVKLPEDVHSLPLLSTLSKL